MTAERKLAREWSTDMELLDALALSFEHTGNLVAGVHPEQMGTPTPCTEWDVHALLAHTIGVVENIGRGVRGDDMSDPNSTALDSDVGAQFRASAAATLAAWRAADLDGETDIGAGPMPAMVAVRINLLDTTAHAWDIARATGQPAELPPGLAETALEASGSVIDDATRQFAGIGAPVPVGPDAGPTEAFVAFLGRTP